MGLIKYFSAYRIVHRLPGRIRIQIPILERLPDDWRVFLGPTCELIKLNKGINKAEIEPTSGSLLIGYNPEVIAESDVIKWLENLVAKFLELDIPSDPLDKANISLRFELLRNRLRQEKAT